MIWSTSRIKKFSLVFYNLSKRKYGGNQKHSQSDFVGSINRDKHRNMIKS